MAHSHLVCSCFAANFTNELTRGQAVSMDCKCDCGNLDVEKVGRCRTVCDDGWDAPCEAIGCPPEDETSAGKEAA